jgi:hypothetical protein
MVLLQLLLFVMTLHCAVRYRFACYRIKVGVALNFTQILRFFQSPETAPLSVLEKVNIPSDGNRCVVLFFIGKVSRKTNTQETTIQFAYIYSRESVY